MAPGGDWRPPLDDGYLLVTRSTLASLRRGVAPTREASILERAVQKGYTPPSPKWNAAPGPPTLHITQAARPSSSSATLRQKQLAASSPPWRLQSSASSSPHGSSTPNLEVRRGVSSKRERPDAPSAVAPPTAQYTRVSTTRTANDALENALEEALQEGREVRGQLIIARAEHSAAREEIEKLQNELTKQSHRMARDEAASAPGESDKAEERVQALEEILRAMTAELQAKTLERTHLRGGLEQAKAAVETAVARAVRAEEQAALWRKAATTALATTEQTESELARLREQLQEGKPNRARPASARWQP